MQTYWLPHVSPFFRVIAPPSDALRSVPFFYWHPLLLAWGGIRCPSCAKGSLTSVGLAECGPRRVLTLGDEGDVFWLVGVRYTNLPDCQLDSTYADVDLMKKFLTGERSTRSMRNGFLTNTFVGTLKFHNEDIIEMKDDRSPDDPLFPSRKNLVRLSRSGI